MKGEESHTPSHERFKDFEGIAVAEEEIARRKMRRRGRAQEILRSISIPDRCGQWGISRHRGTSKNYR